MKRNYMTGPGGRLAQNAKAPGMSMEEIKKHYSLIPIFVVLGVAVIVPALYCARLATKSTDVSFSKNVAPWDDYTDKAFKFINISGKEHIPSPKPKYE